jgi:hypothetical protein
MPTGLHRLHLRAVTAGYDARSGFVVRNDYVRVSPAMSLDWRPHWRPRFVRRFQPGFTLEHFLDPRGAAVQEGFISLRPFTVQFEHGGQLQYAAQPSWQRPRATFRPVPGIVVPPGSYDNVRHSLSPDWVTDSVVPIEAGAIQRRQAPSHRAQGDAVRKGSKAHILRHTFC